MNKPLTQARLKEVLDYDPMTGVFVWRVNKGTQKANARAGSLHKEGYWYIKLDGKLYLASRLAWLYMTGRWPMADMDHINLCRGDDRWNNLREATRSQNCANKQALKNNTSGFKGVRRHRNKWQALIGVNGEYHYLGVFITPEEAYVAYRVAAKKYFGEFAR